VIPRTFFINPSRLKNLLKNNKHSHLIIIILFITIISFVISSFVVYIEDSKKFHIELFSFLGNIVLMLSGFYLLNILYEKSIVKKEELIVISYIKNNLILFGKILDETIKMKESTTNDPNIAEEKKRYISENLSKMKANVNVFLSFYELVKKFAFNSKVFHVYSTYFSQNVDNMNLLKTCLNDDTDLNPHYLVILKELAEETERTIRLIDNNIGAN
jgi:hypothetical protein